MDALAYCWGGVNRPNYGIAGAATPRVVGPTPFRTLSSGETHACGISTSGAAYCWGRNEAGQRGIGTADQNWHSQADSVRTPVRFSTIASGNAHTCAVDTNGGLYCWGNFPPGYMSARLDSARYRPVALARGISFTSVSTDGKHVCGVTAEGHIVCI